MKSYAINPRVSEENLKSELDWDSVPSRIAKSREVKTKSKDLQLFLLSKHGGYTAFLTWKKEPIGLVDVVYMFGSKSSKSKLPKSVDVYELGSYIVPEFRNKGYGKAIYLWFLKNGLNLGAGLHSRAASRVWDSLAKEPGIHDIWLAEGAFHRVLKPSKFEKYFSVRVLTTRPELFKIAT